MERQCKGLEQCIELYLDGHLINLPELESIVVLNIPCWGAGVYLWTLGLGNYLHCIFYLNIKYSTVTYNEI